MRNLPSLLALRAFEAAARLQNFSLAGEELHLTPSAISHHVRSLERHFARTLFLRHNRRVELTPDGRRLLSKLTSAFDTIEAACAELKPIPATQSLAVRCAPSFASKWLGPLLPALMHLHPNINIRMTANAEPVDLLRHEQLDLVITYGAPIAQVGVEAEALGSEAVLALCSPALAAGMDAAGRDLLSRVPLIESTNSPVTWADWADINGLKLVTRRSGPSFDRGALAIAAAVQGVGVALETTRFAKEEIAKGELVELCPNRFQPVRRELHFLCYRISDKSLPKIRNFRDWLIAQCLGP